MYSADQVRARRRRAALARFMRSVRPRFCLSRSAECGGPIANAHSVQRAVLASHIAVEGHVASFRRTIDGVCELERVGLNKATVFPGFCSFHDTAIFKTIDVDGSRPLNMEDPRQQALFALRAASRELYEKQAAILAYEKIVRWIDDRDIQVIQKSLNLNREDANFLLESRDFFGDFLRGLKIGRSDLDRWFGSLLGQIRRGKFHQIHTVSLSIEGHPCLGASAAFHPEWDLDGEEVADLMPYSDAPGVAMTVIPRRNGHSLILSFHRRHANQVRGLVRQLSDLDPLELRLAVSHLLVTYCENVVYSPTVVESWPLSRKEYVERLFGETLFFGTPPTEQQGFDLFS